MAAINSSCCLRQSVFLTGFFGGSFEAFLAISSNSVPCVRSAAPDMIFRGLASGRERQTPACFSNRSWAKARSQNSQRFIPSGVTGRGFFASDFDFPPFEEVGDEGEPFDGAPLIAFVFEVVGLDGGAPLLGLAALGIFVSDFGLFRAWIALDSSLARAESPAPALDAFAVEAVFFTADLGAETGTAADFLTVVTSTGMSLPKSSGLCSSTRIAAAGVDMKIDLRFTVCAGDDPGEACVESMVSLGANLGRADAALLDELPLITVILLFEIIDGVEDGLSGSKLSLPLNSPILPLSSVASREPIFTLFFRDATTI